MNRRVSIWLCLCLALWLSSCAGQDAGEAPKPAETEPSATAEESIGTAEQSADTPQTVTPEQPTEAAQPATAEQPMEAAQPMTAEQPMEAARPVTPEQSPKTPQARDLTESECRQWSEFLSQEDCYGFLMSAYSTPLDADLGQVFYNGAGVGESPTQEMIAYFLNETGFEEAYMDITFIPYDAANQVLQRRTGYSLEHFKLSGNDIPMFYSQKYAGYFQMAGDTNRMLVECLSGRENPDGSIVLESREKSWYDEPDADDEFTSSFETTLRPDAQGRGMVFDSNVIKGGWLTWVMDE